MINNLLLDIRFVILYEIQHSVLLLHIFDSEAKADVRVHVLTIINTILLLKYNMTTYKENSCSETREFYSNHTILITIIHANCIN